MDRERLLGNVRRGLRTPLVAWRRAPGLRAGRTEWDRFRVEVLRYAVSGINFSSPAAHRYCVGRGLEIGGAASNPFDLDSRNVDLTDSLTTVFKQSEIALCGRALGVDIVAAGDELPVPDESQDFVVSSHVLEHFTDPVKALLEWNRVVRPGGVIFMIVPHRDRTFEAGLPRTPLEHVIADYEAHCVEPEGDLMGHNHVWVTEDIVELVLWMKQHFSLAWEIVEVQDVDDKVGNGFAIVIRKLAA
jgi:SAM-dependent methyltransferase